jgi:Ca-activated chloride channel family protein
MRNALHVVLTTCASLLLVVIVGLVLVACNGKYEGSRMNGNATPATPDGPSVAAEIAGPVMPTDELWVIAKPDGLAPTHAPRAGAAQHDADEAMHGTGSMVTTLPGEDKPVPMPLKHTSVDAYVSAYIATVDVQQQFHNPFDTKIEAVYVFPLPQNAAINEFVMTIGDRRIRGIIRDRAEAKQIYTEARAQGHVASLLTQERPNIFTQKVANIEPGKQIDVNIKYYNTLAWDDGWYEFVFPMVVGPRFNPPAFKDGIGAVGRGLGGASGQKTEVQYLKPGERSGHDITLNLHVDAGVLVEDARSVNHQIAIDQTNSESPRQPWGTKFTVSLDPGDRLPNKDFVFRWKVTGEQIKTNVLTHRDQRGGYFTVMLYPPDDLKNLPRSAMEMIFVLDCSGSMSGKPIEQAKDAIVHGLGQLQPGDTFQVIRFSNDASTFGDKPVPANRRAVDRAVRYVKALNGTGGTMMIEGIKAALDFPHEPDRMRVVTFMTDGYIGNDRQIIGEVKQRVGDSRVFSFGVGSSPNRYLMDRMAKHGRGAVAYLSLKDNGDEVMDRFFERISHPALTDVTLSFGQARVSDVYPRQIPDLIVGRPVIITGRFEGELGDRLVVTGKAAGKKLNIVIPTGNDNAVSKHPGIASVWARTRIADLYDQATYDNDKSLVREIRETALAYQLMSEYTAFVAVDSARKTDGDHGVTVPQAVPVPDGVKYDTTVMEQ